MPPIPVMPGKAFFKSHKPFFVIIHINGSHHQFKHPDSRFTTLPVQKSKVFQRVGLEKLSVMIWNRKSILLLNFGTSISKKPRK